MKNLVAMTNKSLAFFTICLLAFLVLCVSWQVISRYVLDAPSTETDELARYLFMWVAMIGAAYTTGQHRHLAIDLLMMKLTGVKKSIIGLIIQATIILFSSIVLLYGGSLLVSSTLENGQITPVLGWKMGYIYLCLPISGLLMIFYALVDVISIVQHFSGQPPVVPENY
ncbi:MULTISPECIES: TRAP transporter small permease [Xenorhabdus]|uniref:TRAP transporter small permease protein n=1 Tax=Xenorhabdus ehlersii TaxID=290111 RepID=A0A2D0IN32_9GAMM|nr:MULTISPECIES: TRAP transporter small permease [Xenorhabdus]MBC8948079.1 C4-dicarboxylate ABC transporter permease [Xenorhabdus sp. TS4]PHM23187.1 C4-dicarboxylate ABC transporter permease [Xenorhabdus ehlersii]RKE89294.1 TRAP-type C4-dicarboxylate transport system permease small subunit [Xenorhabdus ehlersii]